MPDPNRRGPTGLVARLAARLRFPQLFLLTAVLFLADTFLILDPIPFVDELLLGLVMALFGIWRAKRRTTDNPESAGAVDVKSGS